MNPTEPETAAAPSEDDRTRRSPFETFASDLRSGLRGERKELPAKYLYDARGVELFDAITELPEYYPTRTENLIYDEHLEEMAQAVGLHALVIEPGSGNGTKTQRLLDALEDPVGYVPIEIAAEYLAAAVPELEARFPGIEILPVHGDFTQITKVPVPARDPASRLLFFPGSTIGNFHRDEAEAFLRRMRTALGRRGRILIGVDRLKGRARLEAAYDDAQGVTAAFNLNLLDRINRELDGNIDVRTFRHRAVFNVELHRIEMRLESLVDQTFEAAGTTFSMKAGESLLTEVSNKYADEDFRALAERAGFEVAQTWTDDEQLFGVWLLR